MRDLDAVLAELRPTETAADELLTELHRAEKNTLGGWVFSLPHERWLNAQRYLASADLSDSNRHWSSRVWLRVVCNDHRTPQWQWEAQVRTVDDSKEYQVSRVLGPPDDSDKFADFERRAAECDQMCAEVGWHLIQPEPGELSFRSGVVTVTIGGVRVAAVSTKTGRTRVVCAE